MAVVSEPPRAVYAAAVETLAGGIVRALEGAGDTFRLADQLGGLGDWTAGLAAVRVLGPDALLPFTLGPHRFGPDDAEVIAASLRAFPAPEPQVNADHGVLPVRALRDWATGQVLTRLGVTDFRLDPPTLPDAAVDSTWTVWAGGLARLSPLAAPGLDSALHAWASTRRLDTARGLTRAMMRRDHRTAARLARWLAVGDPVGTTPLAVQTVLRHLELLAGSDASTALELAAARAGSTL